MADYRAERIEIAGVEGVSRRADNSVRGGVAVFRDAADGRNNRHD